MVGNIGSNLGILNNLLKTQQKLKNSFSALSSGQSVSSRSDPAGLAIASELQSQASSLSTVNRGIDYTQSALTTAEGGLGEVRSNLQRMREIALQSSNGTLSQSDRSNLQNEFESLQENVNSLSQNTKFGNTSLLDGSFSQQVQTGANAGENQSVSIDGVSTADLGIADEGVSTQASAQDALSAIDSALDKVNSASASIGASQNALEFRQSANAVQQENLAAAQSQIADTDYASELSNLSKQKFLQQAQIEVLKAQQKSAASISQQFFGGLGKK